jgi:hypothetical protein
MSFLGSIFISSFSSIVAILASIGSFVSGLAALYTIREVKKQRESAYKPDIFIDSFTAYVKDLPWEKEVSWFSFYTSIFNEEGRQEEEFSKEKHYPSVLLKLINIGLGAAKNVRCTWSFDIAEAYEILKSELTGDFHVSYEKAYVKPYEKRIVITREKSEFYKAIDRSLFDQEVDFILPEVSYANKKRTTIPMAITDVLTYFALFRNKLHLNSEREELVYEAFKNFPSVSLALSYEDLYAKKHVKRFKFDFQFMSVFSSTYHGIYHITVKEVN